MQFIKSKLFNFLLVIWTLLFLVPIPFLILGRNADLRVRRCSKFYCKGFLFLCSCILNLTFEIRGKPDLSGGSPVIFAAKHQSAWETLALYYSIPKIVPVLKASLTKIPIFGWYLRRLRLIAVDREEGRKALLHMFNEAEAAVAEDQSLLIFPEGTRQLPLHNPELKSGIFLLYRRLGLRVVPIALNSGIFWPKGADTISAGRVTVSFLQPIEPGLERREFLNKLHASLSIESDNLVTKFNVS